MAHSTSAQVSSYVEFDANGVSLLSRPSTYPIAWCTLGRQMHHSPSITPYMKDLPGTYGSGTDTNMTTLLLHRMSSIMNCLPVLFSMLLHHMILST